MEKQHNTLEKVRILIQSQDFTSVLDETAKKYCNFGAMEAEVSNEDFSQAKAVMFVSLREMAERFAPLSAHQRDTVKNLERF